MRAQFFSLLCLLTSTLAWGQLAKPMIFGEGRVSPDGKPQKTDLKIYWASSLNPLADFIRNPALDETKSKLNQGVFLLPSRVTGKNTLHDASVNFAISVTIDGVPSDCVLLERSPDTDLNKHLCPHIIKFARFHPPLDPTGQRVAFRGQFSAVYGSQSNTFTVVAPREPNSRKASPIAPPTVSSLRMASQSNLAQGLSATLTVKVNETGKAVLCELIKPTFVDDVDSLLCAKALALGYLSALDYKGDPVAEFATLTIRF